MSTYVVWLRRCALFTLLVGLALFGGLSVVRELVLVHVALGLATVALALRLPFWEGDPDERPADDDRRGVRLLAPLGALLTLGVGLLMLLGVLRGFEIVFLHMTLGVFTLGLIEMAVVRRRHAARPTGETERAAESEHV